MFTRPLGFVMTLSLLLLSAQAMADRLHVAVASNFTAPAQKIAEIFEQESGHKAIMSFGSTGKHYIQIIKGAPFKVFLAADAERPERLEKEGHGVAGTRFTYAQGQIALYSAIDGLDLASGEILRTPDKFKRLAIANPKTAPYGQAAVQALENLGVVQIVAARVVKGNNIAQTYQFVSTRNAEIGLVALSQIKAKPNGTHWVVPANLYEPIAQQALLLKKGEDDAAAKAFMDFLKGPIAKAIIADFGYKVTP